MDRPATLPFDSRMTRHDDHESSEDAADLVRPHLSALQWAVLLAFIHVGGEGMSDQYLQRMARFADPEKYAESTVRHRRSDLAASGLVEENGKVENLRPKGKPVIRWKLTELGRGFYAEQMRQAR